MAQTQVYEGIFAEIAKQHGKDLAHRHVKITVEDTKNDPLTSNPLANPFESTHPLSVTWDRLNALSELDENWNGHQVLAPNPHAIEHAKAWIQSLYCETTGENHRWIGPHVSASEEGEVVFEWVRKQKRLAIYISPQSAVSIKSWGADVLNEMTDEEAMSAEARRSLWSWLLEQP